MFVVRSQERNKMITMVSSRYMSCGAQTEKNDTSGMTFIILAEPSVAQDKGRWPSSGL
jgi:hypothetical protein